MARPDHDADVGVVHIVEVGGRGGVFHHSVGVAQALVASGVEVVLHTASDAEHLDDDVERCTCMSWSRRAPRGIRQAITATRFLARTCPHLVRVGRTEDTIHVQGLFGNQLTAWLIFRLSRRGRRVAFSPHNTFARSGRRVDERTIRWMARRAGVVFAFSDDDRTRVASWGANTCLAALVHHIPEPTDDELARWKKLFAERPVALLAGQVRADKRPDVFVNACRLAGVTPAVVGPANDGESLLRAAAEGTAIVRVDGYVPLQSFVAAVRSADVIVATHAVGSVSGPLAFAADLGVRSVAPVIGGLAESVTVAVEGDTAEDFAASITAALALPAPDPRSLSDSAEQHLAGYRSIVRGGS